MKSPVLRILLSLALLVLAPLVWAATCAVDISQTNQFIRGFGASSAWHTNAYTTAQANIFWDQSTMNGNNPAGIGLSLLRCRIPPDSTTGELAVMKQAIGMGCTQVWATEWSAPASMKDNNNLNNGGTLLAGSYAAYAAKLLAYANLIQSNGVTLMCISPQNEPDMNVSYESGIWTGQLFHDFVKNNLGPAFVGNHTKIMIPEPSKNSLLTSGSGGDGDANTTLNDASAATFVSFIGTHLYGSGPLAYANTQLNAPTGGREYWETEMMDYNGGAASDDSMTDGMYTAGLIHRSIADSNMNAYHFWWLVCENSNTNQGLIDYDGATVPKRTWCIGNWSRFVRPGFYRAGATEVPTAGVSISSYKNSNSNPTTIVIVALNNNGSSQSVTFNLTGGTVTQETPWVTDSGNNLARQTTQTVTGNSFTYSLNPTSVTTFVCVIGAVGPTATFTNTLPPTATFTRTPTPIPGAYCMIDNFEDGNTTNNWGGAWASYGDANTTVAFSVVAGGAPGSTAYSGTASGSVSNYGGVSCPLGGTVDLSPYTGGVVFYAKGSGTYWFQMAIPAVTDGDNFGVSFTANAAWTPVTVLFSQLAQRGFGTAETFSPTQVTLFQWASVAAGNYNLQLDDVRMMGAYCPGGTPSATPTASPTSTGTFTPTRSSTATFTATFTPTATATATATFTATRTSTPTFSSSPTFTFTATATSTRTNTPSFTPSPSATPTSTFTATATATASATRTATPSPTYTNTLTATATPTATSSPTATPTRTSTFTSSPTSTPTRTNTATPTASATGTFTPSSTATNTPTRTFTAPPSSTSTPTATSTWTRTATSTSTFTSTSTATVTPTFTRTSTPTFTSTLSPTFTFTPTVTNTPPPGATATFTPSVTYTSTPTSSPTRTMTPSPTWTVSSTPTPTSTASSTPSDTPSMTRTPTATVTSTPSMTRTSTPTATPTDSQTPTITDTPPPGATATFTPTDTATATDTRTLTSTPSATPTRTATSTSTPTLTPTSTFTAPPSATPTFSPTVTSTPTDSKTPTASATFSPTRTATATSTSTLSSTPTPTSSPTNTRTDTPTPTVTITPSDTRTPTPTSTPTNSATRTASPTATSTWTPSLTPTATPTATPSLTSTNTLTPTPTRTPIPTSTWTWTDTFTSTPSATPTATPTYTPTLTASPTPTPSATWTPTDSSTATPTWSPSLTASPSATPPPECPPVALSAAYPNPSYNPWTPVRVNLTSPCPRTVDWKIVTVANRRLASGTIEVSGMATVAWDQRDLRGRLVSNGIYYFLLSEAGQPTRSTKILLLR